MTKALRITLVFVILISAAAANAPGLLLALGNSLGADAKAGSSVAPVDYYAYDYEYDAIPSYEDPGAWLDSLFPARLASWHHTWTDFESPPTADALNPFRRPVHWEPEGVLLAQVSTFSDMGYSDLSGKAESFSNESTARVTSSLFGGFTYWRKEDKDAETPPQLDPPGNEPGPPVPDTDPPPPDVRPDPPVSVPEPAPMGLFALGLAGLFMFGKQRRLAVLTREGRGRN
jgi:hypothetical protein